MEMVLEGSKWVIYCQKMVPGSALRSAVTFLAMQGFQECWWEGMGHNRKGKGLQERVKCEVES